MGSVTSEVKASDSSNHDMSHHNENSGHKNAFDDHIGTDPWSMLSREFLENNPGPFEEIQKDIKEITPQPIDGLKVVTNIPFSENLQVGLNWAYTSDSNSKFNPALNFAGTIPPRSLDRNLMGMAEYDGRKNFALSFHHFITPHFRLKFQIQGNLREIENSELSSHYLGRTFSSSFSVVNPSIKTKSSIFVGQFLKRLTKSVDAGAELAVQSSEGKFGYLSSTAVLRFRHGIFLSDKKPSYTFGDFGSLEPKGTFLTTFNTQAIHLSYIRNISSGFQMFTSYDYTRQSQFPHVSSLGYSYSLPNRNIVLRASYDTTNTLQTVFEKAFNAGDTGWSFTASVAHNFTANKTITGFGIILGK